jgi:hypothetical protein
MLTVHCVTWLGITYFDQTYVVWYFQLAVIVNLTETVLYPAEIPGAFVAGRFNELPLR